MRAEVSGGDDSLTGNVLIASERGHHSGLIGKRDPVGRVRGKQTLQERCCAVEDRGALAADFHTDMHLGKVDELGGNPTNMRWVGRVKVCIAKECTELVRLDL